jgi:hypothetical protein
MLLPCPSSVPPNQPDCAALGMCLPPEIVSEVAARISSTSYDRSPGEVVLNDLDRYYTGVKASLRALDLTVAEASLVTEALWSTVTYGAPILDVVAADVEDLIRYEAADEKWNVDRVALLAKLRAAGPAAEFAIWDAVERVKGLCGEDERTLEESLRLVGLAR